MHLQERLQKEITRENRALGKARDYRNPDLDHEAYDLPEINYDFFAQNTEIVRTASKKIYEYLKMPLFRAFNQRRIDETIEQLQQLATISIVNRNTEVFQYELQVCINLFKQLSQELVNNKQDLTRERRDTWRQLKMELQIILHILYNFTDETTEALSDDIDPS
jgi:hypothetical protein